MTLPPTLPCDQCTAPCCRSRPRAGYAAHVEPDEVVGYRDRLVEHVDGIMLVPFDDQGDCIFLVASRCSVQDSKPRDCRKFRCNEHAPFLQHQPAVIALLTREGIPIFGRAA